MSIEAVRSTELIEIVRVPELYDNQDNVPLEPGENARRIIVRTTADGGYVGNHFEVASGTRLTMIGFDKTNPTASGEDSWFHRAYVNSADLEEHINHNGIDENIILKEI